MAEVIGDSTVGISGHRVGGDNGVAKGLRGGEGGAESELLGAWERAKTLGELWGLSSSTFNQSHTCLLSWTGVRGGRHWCIIWVH